MSWLLAATIRRQQPPAPNEASGALRTIKLVHTGIWAFLAACILLIPVASGWGRHWLAAGLVAIVAVEVAILALNQGRCPLTSLAGRHTEDRGDNFDLYLPEWLARYNKPIFGALYVAGTTLALVRWALAAH